MLKISTGSKLVPLPSLNPGKLFIDRDGQAAMASMRVGLEPSPQACAYIPLTGPDAFKLSWLSDNGFGIGRAVISAGDHKSAVRPGAMREAMVGSVPPNISAATRGELMFFEDAREAGAHVVVTTEGGALHAVNLATGRLWNPSGYLGLTARDWTFEAWNDDGEVVSLEVDATEYKPADDAES